MGFGQGGIASNLYPNCDPNWGATNGKSPAQSLDGKGERAVRWGLEEQAVRQ